MIVAYVLGKLEEDECSSKLNWIDIIETGLFEFLQRIVITDLKPSLFNKIKENKDIYLQLNEWVFRKIEPIISDLGSDFCSRFHSYLMDTNDSLVRNIIGAARFYVTKWEFEIIQKTNTNGYLVAEVNKNINGRFNKYKELKCMKTLLKNNSLDEFLNICGQLRFQLRWSQLYRVPETSVLGHMLIVAIYSYLFSFQNNYKKEMCINNYFTGLFHDLPEVLTKDIINPVKVSVEGIDEIIKQYEHEEMQRIYGLLPDSWHSEMKLFTEDEFSVRMYRDGDLIKASDDLASFIEVYLSLKNGIQNEQLLNASYYLKEKYNKYELLSGINFRNIYADFE